MALRTKFTDNLDLNCPLNEHPRPQFMRENWLSLNGQYEYAVTRNKNTFPKEYDGHITVPFAIESELSGVKRTLQPDERLWYRRLFTVPDSFKGKRVILHFDAVDWQCHVYINKRPGTIHKGGYSAFSLDITDLLKDGENELIVRVFDPSDKGLQQRGKQTLKSHGFWYTATSGIWQPVWLEAVETVHIDKIRLTPDFDKGKVRIQSFIKGAKGDVRISATVTEKLDGGEVIFSGDISEDDCIEIPDFIPWSPENPHLYGLSLELYAGDELKDSVKSYFGIRKFSVGRDGKGLPRLLLNNKPYFHNGLLDQGYWPESGLTPPSDEAMIYDIQTIKDLGFNMLRKHIKVEMSRWYYHCDRIGVLVWQDMPNGGGPLNAFYAGVLPTIQVKIDDHNYPIFKRTDPQNREEYRTELKEMIDELYNYTSICVWVPFNEGWGQFEAKETGEFVKQYDPSRIVDHASGWYDMGGPDLLSVHRYILPVTLPKIKDRPYALTEFGGYSQIIKGHVYDEKKSFGYKMYRSKETLTAAYRKLFEKQIIPLIEKGLSAAVYTQVSDVEFEVNGIMTYDRRLVKIDENTVKELNERMRL